MNRVTTIVPAPAASHGIEEMPVAFVLRSAAAASDPEVSVVITTKNHGAVLHEAVTAVLRQDFGGQFELIVCDNASPDNTGAMMRDVVREARRPVTYARLKRDAGAAGGRNLGLRLARGRFIAFTDSDCVPAPDWLSRALRPFTAAGVGIVEGRVVVPRTVAPLFSHFIEVRRPSGSFCTSNVLYRREALGRREFDPRLWYWEDSDLGWRVHRDGWQTAFAGDAVVAHQIMPLSPLRWLLWPRRYKTFPQRAARYPESRRYLFLRHWVEPAHLLADVALLGIALAAFRRKALVLCLPYAMNFKVRRHIGGRLRLLKVAAYVGWDTVACVTLIVASIRHRSVVL